MGTFTERDEMEHLYTQNQARSISCLEAEIQSLKDQLEFYQSKVNRMYLLAESLDEEALDGVWTDSKQSKMRAAALIRQRLEG